MPVSACGGTRRLLDPELRREKNDQDEKFRLDWMAITRVRKRNVVDRWIRKKQQQVEFCSGQALPQGNQQAPKGEHRRSEKQESFSFVHPGIFFVVRRPCPIIDKVSQGQIGKAPGTIVNELQRLLQFGVNVSRFSQLLVRPELVQIL